ncbi:transporter substrate-binding domain-containing protein [Actinomycetaceae bacterium WB03_NA08]|uniref:Transporter substrate-binding domain-containing protein n=1 Tax=Scrofimicrobium canadense TaxID=2652290 RepID=A0A6N7VT43_9ACTO|nr:transporter substrate-binding domain-containing protein [Scrofimicrobium canadense]MSS84949.1 transporter substrate-binding domain-containing protein [Scrofimicrobium canadense]
MRKVTVALSALSITALALAGCSDPDSKTETPASQETTQSQGAASSDSAEGFDFSKLDPVDEIVALVPENVKDAGILRNGASTDYPPGEFRAEDGQTPVGYDIDIVKAIALVMGLEDGTTTHAEFPTIIPALGTKFDVGASSFTITPERLEQTNMVSYLNVGSSYAVAAGNPQGFDPADPCGAVIGVQNGTFQFDYINELSEKCVADGKKAIDVKPHDLQSDVTTKVVGGQYDATFADSPVAGYAVVQTGGQVEVIGESIESAPQGIVVKKEDAELAAAVQAALQYLMDEGYFEEILAVYGAQDSALPKAEVNPKV